MSRKDCYPSDLTLLYGRVDGINKKWFSNTKHKVRVDRNQYGVSVSLYDPTCPEKGSFCLTGKNFSAGRCLKKLQGLDSSGSFKKIRNLDYQSRRRK